MAEALKEAGGAAPQRVTIAGRRWRVAGDPEDSYFLWAASHARGMDEIHAVAAAILPEDGSGVALDIGANIGMTALVLAALAPAGRVLAVEPSPRTAQALRETLALNGMDGRVEVEQCAVSAAPGEAQFHFDAGHSAGSKLVNEGTMDRASIGAPVTVPVTTLDALAEAHGLERLDLVKVDVEGFEGDVLDGAAATIARHRPAFILEFNAWTLLCNRNANPRTVLEDWLSRFPFVHAFRGVAAAPERVRPEDALAFLHDHLVKRGCADDLVLSFDDAWVARWRPPPGGKDGATEA